MLNLVLLNLNGKEDVVFDYGKWKIRFKPRTNQGIAYMGKDYEFYFVKKSESEMCPVVDETKAYIWIKGPKDSLSVKKVED
ncbi:hypothetical protein D3C73_1520180 [compost metagenome]